MKVKIKKLVHSCLYIEVDNKKILIDPGEYSKEALLDSLDEFKELSYLLITHEHFDHLYLPIVKKLVKNKNLKIVAPLSVGKILKEIHIESHESGNNFISIEFAKHEKLFDTTPPENLSFTIKNTITHPGDSLSFEYLGDILALPIQAPWGSVTAAVEVAIRKKPKYIIPIHDWHWKNEVRKSMYKRLSEYFKKYNIIFIDLYSKDTISITI